MAIDYFRGENFYLSSMYPLENGVQLPDGREVPCVEIAYLQERFVNPEDREAVIRAPDGFDAKKITRELQENGAPIDPDWETHKLGKLTVMKVYVAQKFERNQELAEKLLATGDQEIIEGNTWKDTFWGVYPRVAGQGENHLGRILMDQRTALRRQNSSINLALARAALSAGSNPMPYQQKPPQQQLIVDVDKGTAPIKLDS